jgi:hypothetical protein
MLSFIPMASWGPCLILQWSHDDYAAIAPTRTSRRRYWYYWAMR